MADWEKIFSGEYEKQKKKDKADAKKKFTVQNPVTGVLHKFDTQDQADNYIKIQIEKLNKKPKPTEVQKRNERLGISQAEYDSTVASTKFPQFTTAAQKKEKARKEKIADDKKAKTSYEKVQKERTPDKLASYVKKWKELEMDVKIKKGKPLELAKRRQQALLKQIDNAGLKQAFHEQILDTDLPDQIMIDPKTKKKYRFVGPDRNDPNSYEEV